MSSLLADIIADLPGDVAADAGTMLGKISAFLLGALFVGYGVWRLAQFKRH